MRTIEQIVTELKKDYTRWSNEDEDMEAYDDESVPFFNEDRTGSMVSVMLVPQEENYKEAFKKLRDNDVLMDMGAGDLRFALRASALCKKVYAVEMNTKTLTRALNIIGYGIPRNLIVICADWRDVKIPEDVTVIMCLCNGADLEKRWLDNKRAVYHGTVTTEHGARLVEVGH